MKIYIYYLTNLRRGWWLQVVDADGSAVTASQAISRDYAKNLVSQNKWEKTSKTFCKMKVRGFIS